MRALTEEDGPLDRLRRRAARAWRRRSLRRFALSQVPALALALLLVRLAADPAAHLFLAEQAADLRTALTAREAFAIRRVVVEGADPVVEAELRAAVGDARGVSSLDLDPARVRARIEELGWVASARVALEAPETLRIAVRQREAAAVWRVDGEPWLIGADGVAITPAFSRAYHPDLPLLVGPGADEAAAEALEILAASGALRPHVRGLVRVGRRRWDVALVGDMRVMLPAAGAAAAMRTAAALDREHALRARAVAVVDLRLPERPTIRLTEPGLAELLELRAPQPKGRDA